jgi:hypothetical protein
MLFELKTLSDEKIEKDYKQMMRELNDFYDINWTHNLPDIYFLESRDQIDAYWGKKTDPHVIGWINEHKIVYALRNEKMETESAHKKHSDEKYYAFIKHELSHCFFKIESQFSNSFPNWFWEGVAIYTSGQLAFKESITEFKDFLNYNNQEFSTGVYKESGFVVELLVSKFGKKKILALIKKLKDCQTEETFNKTFEKIYGFKPTYKKFNDLNKK